MAEGSHAFDGQGPWCVQVCNKSSPHQHYYHPCSYRLHHRIVIVIGYLLDPFSFFTQILTIWGMHLRIRPNRCWNICWSVCLAHDPGGCVVHPQLPWRGSRHGAQGHQHQQTGQDQHQCSILKNLWRIQKTQKRWDNVANDHHLKRLSFDANNASKLDWAGRSCKRRTVITKRTWNHQSVKSESIHAACSPKERRWNMVF